MLQLTLVILCYISRRRSVIIGKIYFFDLQNFIKL